MVAPRPTMTIMESHDKIFFIGGGELDDTPEINVYDAITTHWRPRILLSPDLRDIAGTVVDSTAIFIGSPMLFKNDSDFVFAYDINNEELRSIPVTRNVSIYSDWQDNKWRSISVGSKAYFYNDDRIVIVDIYNNTAMTIRSQAGQYSIATTNGTHLIFASWGIFLLNLETLEWTNEHSSSPYRPTAIFYVDDAKRNLIIVTRNEVRITSLDSLDNHAIIGIKEPANLANLIGEAIYIVGETGVSVVYYKTTRENVEQTVSVFYQLGSTNIKAYRSMVYNGSIYYTSRDPAVYQMDLQWLMRSMDLNLTKAAEQSKATAKYGYYFYFNTQASAIHTYKLATGQLEIVGQRNFPTWFSREDTSVIGNKLLVLRTPEYDTFDFDTNTWHTAPLPYNISTQNSKSTDKYAVFYGTTESNINFYLFNLANQSWTNVETSSSFGYIFIVQDRVVLVLSSGNLKIYDILTRQWHDIDLSPPPTMATAIQCQSSIVIGFSNMLKSSLLIYDVATDQKMSTEVVGPIESTVNAYGDFVAFAVITEKSNLQTIRMKIFNIKQFSWKTLDLPPNYSNDLAVLAINNNVAYLARPERVEAIDLLTFTVNTIVTPIKSPTQIYFVGNKVVFVSSSQGTRILTMYDTSVKTSTSIQFSYQYYEFDNLRATENYIIAKIGDQMHFLEISALFNGMPDAKIFIGESANFTANPRGQLISRAYWEDKYGNFYGAGLSLSLNNVSLNSAGTYTIRVFDQCQQQMQQSAQLVVNDIPSFTTNLNDVIVLCNDSTTVLVNADGEQVDYSWTIDGKAVPGEFSKVNVSVSDLRCESSHKLCAIATNPSGTSQSCSLLQVLSYESIFDGPQPYIEQFLWFSESQVQLHVKLLNPECTNHTWLMNGVDMGAHGTQQSEITVHLSTKIENTEFQVEALCINNLIRSRPYKFTNITSLTPLGLSLIIISVALIVAVPILVSVVYRRRLNRSKQQQEDLEMMLSQAKSESIRARDNVTILQPTTWEWIPSDGYTFKAIDNLPFNIDFSALNFSSKNAVDTDVFVQGDIMFSSKQKAKTGVKTPLLKSTHHVDIYVPKSPKYEIVVEPASFNVNSRSPVQVTVSSKLRMTAKCTICLIIVCEQDQTYSAIEFKLESKPSMWIDIDEVKMTEEFLGGGGFGSVTRGVYRGQDVAVKKLLLQAMPEEIITEFEREVSLMKSLHHPNIIQFVGASNVQNNLAIVIEYAPLGSLASAMKKQKLSHALKITMLIETAKALQFLHSNGIVHRDIKPQNILVFSLEPRSSVHVKLTDFGTARFIPDASTNVTRNIGTCGYMAPESLGKNPKISKSADVYSFAILMWEVMFERVPFEALNWQSEIEEHVLSGDRLPFPASSHAHPELVKLIEDCWQQDPLDRPTITAVAQRLTTIV
jgi:type II secretory pathway pseudopilin PulG